VLPEPMASVEGVRVAVAPAGKPLTDKVTAANFLTGIDSAGTQSCPTGAVDRSALDR